MKDYYKILGVKRTATSKEIKAAYRNLAKKHHPDMTGKCEDDEEFKNIHEAYSTLIDPERRKTYNQNLGEKVKINIVSSSPNRKSRKKPTTSAQPEPLIPRHKQNATNFDSLFEKEMRDFEKLTQYLLRRFFDDLFF